MNDYILYQKIWDFIDLQHSYFMSEREIIKTCPTRYRLIGRSPNNVDFPLSISSLLLFGDPVYETT